jgi:glycosyltransferase involved in cell wall biosynthesis
MRILLVGNYALDNQLSMLRYADILCRHISLLGHQVEIIQPQPVLGNLVSQRTLRKWLGYVDKYLIFPPKLRSRASAFDVVHVCDHSNSMYLAYTGICPASVTCHDLIAIASAQGYFSHVKISFTGRVQQRWILKHLVAARNVVCVSTNTAQELAALSAKESQNVSVIPNPINSHSAPAAEDDVLELRRRLGIAEDERYFLHIGGDHWYKNRDGALRVFKLLSESRAGWASGLRLVMAGAPWSQSIRNFVAENQLEASVIEVVDPSDEDLRSLYSGAAALFFPSLNEGFGWPLIEAQACGCPVITSNRQPMMEVAGPAALYIDPANESEAAALIGANLDCLHLLSEIGFRNAARFAPGQVIPAYERFFAEVARGEIQQMTSDVTQEEPISQP